MARCYPFPPRGYAGKWSSDEALILSIKLQKESEKANSNREVEKCISSAAEAEKLKSSSDKDKKKDRKEKKDKDDRKDKKRDREDRKKEKKDKEDRKSEKKEKKREKRAKACAPAESGKQDFADKLSKVENVVVESKGKLQGTSAVLLEKSSVTEEHGQPIESQNAPCSSDSTGNSGKRKRSMPSPSGIQSNGNIIRIRLSTSQKRDEPSISGSLGQEVSQLPQTSENTAVPQSQVRPCVSGGRPETSILHKDLITKTQIMPCVSRVRSESSAKQRDLISKTEGLPSGSRVRPETSVKQKDVISKAENLPSVSCVRPETSARQKNVMSKDQGLPLASTSSATLQEVSANVSGLKSETTVSASHKESLSSHDKVRSRDLVEKLSSRDKKVQKMELTYKKLFVDWVPPPLERALVVDENDDEDWLFGKKDAKRMKASDDVQSCVDNLPCSASAVMQPRAQFFADAGIYALPFTVPF